LKKGIRAGIKISKGSKEQKRGPEKGSQKRGQSKNTVVLSSPEFGVALNNMLRDSN
jgi:hypothetical protein